MVWMVGKQWVKDVVGDGGQWLVSHSVSRDW